MKFAGWQFPLAVLLLAVGCSTADPHPTGEPTTSAPPSEGAAPDEPAHTTLANNLDVVVTPVPDATGVAVTLVFDIGSRHDPPRQSGMAHMVEHLLVTSATEAEPARTVDQLVQSYPLGWNAQTGEDYTVIAVVVDPAQLDGELELIAARLTGVTPTDADLAREEPRLQAELTNMFGGIPEIGAANLARERLRPTPNDGRRGGQPDAVAAMTIDDLIDRLELYHPGNARLSVAGPIDPAATLDMITDQFATIPTGPPPGDPAESGTASPGLHLLTMPPSATPHGPGQIALAYPAPAADDPTFPAFLVATGRLFVRSQAAGFVTSFAPLDDPPHLLVGAPLPAGADPGDVAAALHQSVVSVLDPALASNEETTTTLQFGPILGLPETSGADSYGTAFRAARAPAIGLHPAALAADLESLTPEQFARAVDHLAGQPITGGAVVVENP